MIRKIQILRGNLAALPVLSAGELAFCVDTHQLWCGDGATNTLIQAAKIAEGTYGDIDVTAGGDTWSIRPRVVDAAALAAVTHGKVLGRFTAGNGDVEELSPSDVLNLIGGSSDNAILYKASGAWVYRDSGGKSSASLRIRGSVVDWNQDGVCVFEEQQTSGTHGGASTAGSWATRVLNTIAQDAQGLSSLSANQITLPAGEYEIEASAPCFGTNCVHQVRLKNVSATSYTYGTSEYSNGSQSRSSLHTRVNLGGATVFELQQQVGASTATFGLGIATSFAGTTEVYARVFCRKIG